MYKYYQPNKKDLKDECGDCSIRALSKCFEVSWVEAFKMTIEPVIKHQVLFNDTNATLLNNVYSELGLSYHSVKVVKGKPRPTVSQFAKSTKGDGKHYIAKVAHHFVAIYDGNYYDTWDSGNCCLYGHYSRNDEEARV